MPALETLIEILVGTYMPLLKLLAALLKKTIRSLHSLINYSVLYEVYSQLFRVVRFCLEQMSLSSWQGQKLW